MGCIFAGEWFAESSVGIIFEELKPDMECALLAQPGKNDSRARSSRFTGKGENREDEMFALKQENATFKNQNDQLEREIVKLQSRLNSGKSEGFTGPAKQRPRCRNKEKK